MVKNLLAALGWSDRQWVLFLVVLAAFIVVPLITWFTRYETNNLMLWLTGVVVLIYTVETQGLRLEMVRQNEMAIQPLLMASIEQRRFKEEDVANRLVVGNIGRGPALFIKVRSIETSANPVRWVAKFEPVDVIEAGKDSVIESAIYIETPGEQDKITSLEVTDYLHPKFANQSYDVFIIYEDIDGQSRESVVRMGKGGIRLLKHGKLKS